MTGILKEHYYHDLFKVINPKIPFEKHQVYDQPGDTMQIICAKCGRDELEVGTGSHFTVVRCKKCLHELCVHDG